jgi:hypothetical protein
VKETLESAGYFVVEASWDRAGTGPLSDDAMAQMAQAFLQSIVDESGAEGVGQPVQPQGSIDGVRREGDLLMIRGWAVDATGSLPEHWSVRVGYSSRKITRVRREYRPDVQRHLGLRHALVGFELAVDGDGGWLSTLSGSAVRVACGQTGSKIEMRFRKID